MHGTVYKGEDQWNSKLTEDEVHEIRRLKGKKTQKEIGEMFGVWHSTISLIHSRKQWGWLPDKPEEEETPEVPYLQDVPS